jgi:hypothetical protein
MTEEDKKLLLTDLSSRLTYGVKIELMPITRGKCATLTPIILYDYYISDDVNYLPYLFPLSSMTEEQKTELNDTLIQLELKALNDEIEHYKVAEFEIDFYNKNMFDYRGLIDKELALDATNKNIY